MRKSTRILGAIAVAGLLAAGSAAFTANGITRTAPGTQFIGGTVSQTVTPGVNLSSIVYNSDGTGTSLTSVDLTFDANADGLDPTIVLTISGIDGSSLTCSTVVAAPAPAYKSNCPTSGAVNVTGIKVTLPTTTTP